MLPFLHAVVFDLDGTLLDSAPDIRHALNQTLRAHGRRDVTLAEVKALVGDGLLTSLTRVFSLTGEALPDTASYNVFQDFIRFYRAQKPDPAQMYPGAVGALDWLRHAGVKTGLCTNKQEESTLRLLDQLDLTQRFDFIAGGDTFPVHKPHPGHVLGVLDRLGVTAPPAVMVGDSVNDVRAAHGAGIPCLAVTHGYGVDLEDLGASGLVAGFAELPAALRKLFQIEKA